MEYPLVLVYKGRMVYISYSKRAIEFQRFKYRRQVQVGFFNDLVSKCELNLKTKLHPEISDIKLCVDDKTGIESIFILLLCKLPGKNRFCVTRLVWGGPRNRIRKEDTSELVKESFVDLFPCLEFSCATASDASDLFSTLIYGPRVLLVARNKLMLFGEKEGNGLLSQEFNINCDKTRTDAESTSAKCFQSPNQISKFLFVVSEEDWSVILIHISESWSSSLQVVALEKIQGSAEFEKKDLYTPDFLPQEYASKVSTVCIQVCRKTVVAGQSYQYENSCAVGLNDGYVMTFLNGSLQMCVTPWTHIQSDYASFAVTELLFLSDHLICHTNTKHCFILNRSTSRVMQHWDNVYKPLIGDFLHCGTKQLLLLFGDCLLVQKLCTGYLLTDLQGFVEDRREHSLKSLVPENLQDTSVSASVQQVMAALQEQSQIFARTVAEEEQRLLCKQQFLIETWRCLKHLSLTGSKTAPDRSPPEIPLVPLLGSDKPVDKCFTRVMIPTVYEDVKVQSTWHQIVDNICVVGVKVINTSNRHLKNCSVTLTSASSQSTTLGTFSTRTKIWRCFHAESPALVGTHLHASKTSTSKRQKVPYQVHVLGTKVIQPLESLTVTCALDIADLGVFGMMEYSVLLQYENETCEDLCISKSQDCDVALKKTSYSSQGKDDDMLSHASRDARFGISNNRESIKWMYCGQVAILATEILQQKKQVLQGLEDGIVCTDTELEQDLLALCTIQHTWTCEISFLLHQVTILTECLQKAGFLFHARLGQYVASLAAPACLQLTRVQLLGFHPLPKRVATVLIFARNASQFLLLLRHLSTHLPEDGVISLATEQHKSDFSQLMQRMSEELAEKKRLARAVADSQRNALKNHFKQNAVLNTGEIELKDKGVSSAGNLKLEHEEFADRQRIYHRSRTECLPRDVVVKFLNALRECEQKCDMVVTKFNS